MKTYLLFLLLLGAELFAANYEQLPERATAGDTLVFSLVVAHSELPAKHGFPEIEYPSSFSLLKKDEVDEVQRGFMMGRYKVRKFRYHFIPSQSGVYTLGPVRWEINGAVQELTSPKVQVYPGFDDAALWVGGKLTQTDPYVGEQIRYDLTFGIKVNYQSGPIPLFSSFGKNFWGEYSDEKMEWNRKAEGMFVATSKRKAYLAPIKAGELILPKMGYKYTKQGKPERVVEEKKMGNSYFRSERIEQKAIEDTTYAQEIHLKVKSLPEAGKPATFKGLVGRYELEVEFDKDSLSVGEALTLKITMSGNGRPGYMPDPDLPDLSEFRVVPPESKVSTRIKNGLKETTKIMTYFLYPRRQLDVNLGAVTLDYFDPQKKSYVTLNSGEKTIKVSKGSGVEMAVEKVYDQKQEVKALVKKVLRPIHPQVKIKPTEIRFYENKVYWFLWVMILCTYPLVVYIIHFYRRRSEDHVGNRKRKAKSQLEHRLKEAQEFATQGESSKFYQALGQGILGYYSDLYNLEFHGRTFQQLEFFLQEQNWEQERIEELLKWIKKIEAARYSGFTISENTTDLEAVRTWLYGKGVE